MKITINQTGQTGTPLRGLTSIEGAMKRLAPRNGDSHIITRGPLAGLPQKWDDEGNECLTKDHILALGNAFFFAESVSGLRLTLGLTLLMAGFPGDLRTGEGLAPHHYRSKLSDILHSVDRLYRRWGGELAYLYTWENGAMKGEHVHMMLNLPIDLVVPLKRLLIGKYGLEEGTAFQISRGGYKNASGVDTGFGMKTPKMRTGFFKYFLKGYPPFANTYYCGQLVTYGDLLGLRHKRPGVVSGRRCGYSENLGPKARSSAGWSEIRDLGQLGGLLHQHSDTSGRAGKPFGPKKDRRARGAWQAPRAPGRRPLRVAGRTVRRRPGR